jgi:DNA (cytosine-5)-methyltransferase 1
LAKEGIDARIWWKKDRILREFPPYIRKMTGEMPKWKRQFILRNRKFWDEHGKSAKLDSWLAKTRTFNDTQQKFEWHVGPVEEPDLMDYMIHTRPSGIRVSKMNWIPALVAMAQIPIIGPWGRRISPREAARAQSFGDDFIIHPKDSVAYKQLGNAVNVELIKRIIKEFKKL